MIGAPYVAVGALLAIGGAYFAGRHDGTRIEQAAEARADRAADVARAGLQSQLGVSAEAHQGRQNDRQDKVGRMEDAAQIIGDRPVYRTQCIDADGLQLLTGAAAVANGRDRSDTAGPAAPAPGAAGGRGGADGAAGVGAAP